MLVVVIVVSTVVVIAVVVVLPVVVSVAEGESIIVDESVVPFVETLSFVFVAVHADIITPKIKNKAVSKQKLRLFIILHLLPYCHCHYRVITYC